jgi:hypothetical protein
MAHYRLCDLVIESKVPLGLATVSGKPAGCVFVLLSTTGCWPAPPQWYHHWRFPDGELWLSLAKGESGYLLRFADLADFLVSHDGRDIRCYPAADTPLETIQHLLLDQVMPLVLSSWGKLVLHASAVASPVGAVAFAGETGQGKSTLAATFGKGGLPLLTDDCLMVEAREGRLFGVPSYPGVRLWDDTVGALFEDETTLATVAHYTHKRRLVLNNDAPHANGDPVPLRRLYFLAPPAGRDAAGPIEIHPLSPQEAFMSLVSVAFKLDMTDREMLKREFEALASMATLPLFYSLSFPRNFACLPRVCEAILEHVE